MTATYRLFLPCAAGVEPYLESEVAHLAPGTPCKTARGGVALSGPWALVMALNLGSRLAQRVLVQVAHGAYASEDEIYALAHQVRWEDWFTPRQTFRIDATARRSPLKSLNFALLRVKDGIVDRFRETSGVRPSVDTHQPDVQLVVHFDTEFATLYVDTSGEPLFKRGWRQDKGDAPLKETLAAAMLAASDWQPTSGQPLLDPCCGSGTIAIEAAQIACGVAPGLQRRFGFERLKPQDATAWQTLRAKAQAAIHAPTAPVFASDVAFRMVDFARRNAERAGVAHAIEFHGGDALERPAPAASGLMLLNPPYGERISPRGAVSPVQPQAHPRRDASPSQTELADDFFPRLAAHWKRSFTGWTAWVLSPDMRLPQHMRFKESRRIPLWNGPIECRLFKFDIIAGSARERPVRSEAPQDIR